MQTVLDNIFWHALTGDQAGIAEGAGGARRFAHGYSPIVGFQDPQSPDFAALEPVSEAGERFYVQGWSGEAAPGWPVVLESTMFLMTWQGAALIDDPAPDATVLRAKHVDEAVALAKLTNPGPFGPATLKMGEYFGLFEGGRLVAMAGERVHAGKWREVSGICTHPQCQGRGLARRLAAKVVSRQLQRGQSPFLHVMSANQGARALYLQLGFADYHETVVRVVERQA
jgi:ribosomal protein S18 acetylase RimI-like enzyme